LEAQHAAEAQEALLDAGVGVRPVALPDAELEAAVLSDAELAGAAELSDAEAAEQLASPVAQERLWPVVELPSAFRALWFPPAAAARPPLVRFAHARRSLRTASQ
jgi:hypothetical protein